MLGKSTEEKICRLNEITSLIMIMIMIMIMLMLIINVIAQVETGGWTSFQCFHELFQGTVQGTQKQFVQTLKLP